MAIKKFIDDEGQEIVLSDDGLLIIDGELVSEPGTDSDFGRYFEYVQNGEGYYDSDGHFVYCPLY